jgi:caffeoyl-CoA O-methyltransferase
MDIVHPKVDAYLKQLAAGDDEPVLLEMEALAQRKGFPIVGRLCGRLLEQLARTINAKQIFEMGSGYGYSAYWFSRATGPDGEIHLTDTDPDNQRMALDFLGRAKLDAPIEYHVEGALEAFDSVSGEFDIVYCDIDKDGYPEAWRSARDRVRVGGMFICDNMLWSGRVTGDPEAGPDDRPHWTAAIEETNRAIFNDPDYRATIVPLRDGVIVALRIA